jgi:hypothetical protein
VARSIVLTDVGLGLDDDSARDSVGGLTLQNRTEEPARNDLGVAIVEIAAKYPPQLIPALRLLPRQASSCRHAQRVCALQASGVPPSKLQ